MIMRNHEHYYDPTAGKAIANVMKEQRRKKRYMKDIEFIELCKKTVRDYFNGRVEKTDNAHISTEDVYIVWVCKALQNWKALVSTNVSDGMYYELTYNGDKGELYLDAYKKWENKCIHV